MAVREHGGSPLPAMKPRVTLEDGRRVTDAVTVLLLRSEPEESTGRFRHIVRRTHDPLERHEAAINMLSSAYYQKPGVFTDILTALFSCDSAVAATLLREGSCVLIFEQFAQRYRIPCGILELDSDDRFWQATYWHNCMFNHAMPGSVCVLAFTPDWSAAEAEPDPIRASDRSRS